MSGALGERYGRRNVLLVSGVLVGPLNLLLLTTSKPLLAILYFLAFQATNGTWSGAGYAYQAESFPTRVRGTAIGWLASMFAAGLTFGSLLWTGIVLVASENVAWLVVGVAQGIATFVLPSIRPGQELEAIAT